MNYCDPFGLNTSDSTSQTQHAIQESSPGLKALTIVKYLVSGAMTLAGLVTGNPFLVAGGVIISQVPTGRIVNQTNQDIAFKGESEIHLGQAYLGKESTTYTKVDDIVTPKNTFKTFTLSDVRISYDKDGNIIMKPSIGTIIVNAVVNVGKDILRDTHIGTSLNRKDGTIDKILNHPITTEPYGIYTNDFLLTYNKAKYEKDTKMADLEEISNTLKTFKSKPEGKSYLEEESE